MTGTMVKRVEGRGVEAVKVPGEWCAVLQGGFGWSSSALRCTALHRSWVRPASCPGPVLQRRVGGWRDATPNGHWSNPPTSHRGCPASQCGLVMPSHPALGCLDLGCPLLQSHSGGPGSTSISVQ